MACGAQSDPAASWCEGQKKKTCGTHLVGERFDVLGDRDVAGLDGDLLDAEADVDHLALFSLYHDHSNERVLPGEMISNHRPKVVFWIDVVQHLVIVMRKRPSWRARGRNVTCSIQCFPLCVLWSRQRARGIRRCLIIRSGIIWEMIWPAKLRMSKKFGCGWRYRTTNVAIHQRSGLKECFSHGGLCCV